MQRQVQAILRKQHMRQQAWPGAPARDRMRGRRRLGNLLAAPARVLLAHVLDDLPLPRHQLQGLGDVLAQLMQGTAAARAGRRHRIDHALARQVLGQRPPRRLAASDRFHRHALRCGDLFRRFGLRLVLLELAQLQLELVQQRPPLGRLAVLLMPQPGDGVPERLDLGPIARPLGQQHRLQGSDVVGQGVRGHTAISAMAATPRNAYSSTESSCRIHPATCGRHVRCGSRQSMPSSR